MVKKLRGAAERPRRKHGKALPAPRLRHRPPPRTRAIPPERFPVLAIAGDEFEAAALPAEFQLTAGQIEGLRAAVPSVGRIESRFSNTFFFGTGFAVGADVIATNRHVAQEFVEGLGRGAALTLRLNSCVVNFRREQPGEAPGTRFRITEALLVHPYWDIALLRTEPLPPSAAPLRLTATPDSLQAGRVVAVIGYPANQDGSRMTTAAATVADEIFGTVNGLKRLQPGRLRGPPEPVADAFPSLLHSASTLPGNSGSPVVDAESGEVVGIHYGGQDNASNWSVPTCDLCRDRRVAAMADINFTAGGVIDPAGAWEALWEALGDAF